MELDKTLPSAPELEEAILGAILLQKDAINEISGFLTVEDFYSEKNQHIYRAITELHEAGKPVDILTVSELLQAKKNTRVTPYEISQLTNRVGSGANIEYHGRIVAQKSMQRQLIEISNNTARDAYDNSIDVFELMDRTEQNLLEMVGGKTQGRAVSLNEGVKMLNEKAEQVSNLKPGEISGVDTGFAEINRVTSGFQNTDLIILAARPGVGKTSLAIQIGVNAAKMNQKTLIFSLEMSTLQLTSRIASAETGIASGKMTKTGMSSEEWAQYHERIGTINDLPLQIDDSAGMTIQRIRSIARVHKMKQGLDFIVLDYLQLVAAEKGKNDHEATNEIARNCKLIAKELNVPFLVLSQLSRAVETRGGSKKPQLSDLRGSGGIEEHADTVSFLYRPDYYGAETDHNGEAIEPGYTELEFAKHRSGALDTAKLRFIGELTKFEDYAPSNHFPTENYSRMPTNDEF